MNTTNSMLNKKCSNDQVWDGIINPRHWSSITKSWRWKSQDTVFCYVPGSKEQSVWIGKKRLKLAFARMWERGECRVWHGEGVAKLDNFRGRGRRCVFRKKKSIQSDRNNVFVRMRDCPCIFSRLVRVRDGCATYTCIVTKRVAAVVAAAATRSET